MPRRYCDGELLRTDFDHPPVFRIAWLSAANDRFEWGDMSAARTSAAVALLGAVLAAQQQPFGEVTPDTACTQRFAAERPGLEGVEVQIATYARSNHCHVEFELADAGGRVLAQRTLDAAGLRDNAMAALPCPAQGQSQGRDYLLRIKSADGRAGDAVTLIVDPAARAGELRRGADVVAGRIVFAARYAGDHGHIGELTAGVRAVQTFVAPQNGLQAVAVLLSDFGRKNAGTLHAVLRDPLTGSELAQCDVPGTEIGNEHWLQLSFAPVNDSAGRRFAIELGSPDATASHAVTALLEHQASYDGQLTVGGELRLGRLALTMEQAPQRPSTAAVLRTLLLGVIGVALAAAAIAARALRPWHGRAITAALTLCLLAVVEGYLRNLRLLFFGAAFVFAIGLCLRGARLHGRRRLIAVQFGMSSLLLVFALLGFEFAGDAAPAAAASDTAAAVTATYSYDEARGNPAAFRAWWQQLTGEWHAQGRGCGPLQEPDPLGELPFLVRPNCSSKFFASTIATNSLALRGPEVSKQKGDAFRILCVGESTTMGQTIRADDVPWPERLTALIGAQHRGRRIEVLNGGWAGYDLRHSVIRMRRFFLELQPDLVVVYHGFNSFWMLLGDLPRAMVPQSRVPVLPQRPSRVPSAANCSAAATAAPSIPRPAPAPRATANCWRCAATTPSPWHCATSTWRSCATRRRQSSSSTAKVSRRSAASSPPTNCTRSWCRTCVAATRRPSSRSTPTWRAVTPTASSTSCTSPSAAASRWR
jgi:hypothetical protein